MVNFKIGDIVEFKSDEYVKLYSHFDEISNFEVLDFYFAKESGRQVVNLDGFAIPSEYLKLKGIN